MTPNWRPAADPARLLFLALMVSACADTPTGSESPPESDVIESITVTAAADRLAVTGTLTLSAQARTAGGTWVTSVEFAWSSNDTSVAVVEGGRVRGEGEGSVVITASAAGVEGSVALEVLPIATVRVVEPMVDVVEDDTLQLQAEAEASGGYAAGALEYVWSTSDTAVAVVEEGGQVQAVSPGTVTITATARGVSGTHSLEVLSILGDPVSYVTFEGDTLDLYAWTGESMAYLVPEKRRDIAVMETLLEGIDRGWAYTIETTGRAPAAWPPTTHEGRSTIAVVPSTCGAACGYLGFTGIEFATPYEKTFFDELTATGRFGHLLFYELGRNFWFYGKKLQVATDGWKLNVTDPFAWFHSDFLADILGLTPVNAPDSIRHELDIDLQVYLDAQDWDWDRVVASGERPASGGGTGDARRLVLALFIELYDRFGEDAFWRRFWHAAGAGPDAAAPQDAIDAMVLAASAGAEANLTAVFTDRYRFTVSQKARDAAAAEWGPPIGI